MIRLARWKGPIGPGIGLRSIARAVGTPGPSTPAWPEEIGDIGMPLHHPQQTRQRRTIKPGGCVPMCSESWRLDPHGILGEKSPGIATARSSPPGNSQSTNQNSSHMPIRQIIFVGSPRRYHDLDEDGRANQPASHRVSRAAVGRPSTVSCQGRPMRRSQGPPVPPPRVQQAAPPGVTLSHSHSPGRPRGIARGDGRRAPRETNSDSRIEPCSGPHADDLSGGEATRVGFRARSRSSRCLPARGMV